jgi:hypothetical protein
LDFFIDFQVSFSPLFQSSQAKALRDLASSRLNSSNKLLIKTIIFIFTAYCFGDVNNRCQFAWSRVQRCIYPPWDSGTPAKFKFQRASILKANGLL